MMWDIINEANLVGKLARDITFDHYAGEVKCYTTILEVRRKSGVKDRIPLIIPEKVLKEYNEELKYGKRVLVTGNVRSSNETDQEGKMHVRLYVFVAKIKEVSCQLDDRNEIIFEGRLCREPYFRRTYYSGRSITELLVAQNINHYRSIFLNCIVWGSLAHKVTEMRVGEKIMFAGRFQSREYLKVNHQDIEKKVALEISITKIY